MELWLYLLVTLVSVEAFPERFRRSIEKQPEVPLLGEHQLAKSDKTREAVRECKGKCLSSTAQKAAAEAKAAQAAQNAAGAHAAHMVKTQLAEKAVQAAKAAEAALAGKQAVVEQLQQEVKEATQVVAENTASVQQQKSTVNAANIAANQATAMHSLMVQATQLASTLEKSAHCALQKTKFGLQEKCHNLAEAKARLAHLQHQLRCACSECAATKQAAHCACEAARAACGNARKKKHVANQHAIAAQETNRV